MHHDHDEGAAQPAASVKRNDEATAPEGEASDTSVASMPGRSPGGHAGLPRGRRDRAPYTPPALEALGTWRALTLQQSVPIGPG